MNLDDVLSRLAVALGIGLLIGLERGWRMRERQPGFRAAGIRTFAIGGLLGGITGALARSTGTAEGAGLVLAAGLAVYSAVIAVFERDANRANQTYSATTAVAAMLTYALGAFALIGDMRVAAAAAVAAAGILAAREDIHAWVARISWPELRSALVLLAMSFVVLPALPDVLVGPYGGVNPREVWLIAIVLAAVSFFGYGTVKYFGAERGILLAAAAGGLVSSTAVMLTNARRAAAGEGAPRLLVAGAAVATAISFVRVIAIVTALKVDLLALVGPALAAATLVALGYALITVHWRAQAADAGENPEAKFRNPFGFWQVVGFAIFLGVIILLGRAVGQAYGEGGALIGAAALGLADVDAITVSLTRLVPEPLSLRGAAFAILAAVATNTLSKLAIGAALGRGRFAAEVAAMTAFCWIASLIALWATLALGAA
jgi:uncharacterized membrane protein (DUF4010 family)